MAIIDTTAHYRYPAGFDGGAGEVCFSTLDACGCEKTVLIPGAIVEAGEWLGAGSGKGCCSDPYKQDIRVVFNGVRYLVGYQALRESRVTNSCMGESHPSYSSGQLIRLLATSGLAIPDQNYELQLLTTVPVGSFTRERRRQVKDGINGTFAFTLNGVERQATIHVGLVIVEGPPALVLYSGQSARETRLVVSGGDCATSLVMFDGTGLLYGQCQEVNVGVEDIGNHLAETLSAQHGRKLSPRERSDILRAYASRNTAEPIPMPSLFCGKYELSSAEISRVVAAGCQRVANVILAEARSLWGVTNDVVAGDVKWHYLVGRSALFYHNLLQAKMPLLLSVTRTSVANARGCARMAQALERRIGSKRSENRSESESTQDRLLS